MDRKVVGYEEQLRKRNDSYEVEIRRYKEDSERFEIEVENLRKEILINRRDYEEKKERDANEIDRLKRELNYLQEIEAKYNYEKNKNRDY